MRFALIIRSQNMAIGAVPTVIDHRGITMDKPIQRVAIIGSGLIGAGWASAFLAHGFDVSATDIGSDAEAQLRQRIAALWPDLRALDGNLPAQPPLSRLRFSSDLATAVADADVVQENIPELIDAKIALFAQLDTLTRPDTLLISSSSAFRMTNIQSQCARHPERCVIGHPFNPSHLVPLVEVVGGERTSADTIARTLAFYRGIGKHPVHIRKELEGHVANRLQAALMREVVHLVESGVVDVAGADDICRWGPGLRWALMGPTLVTYLGVPEHRRGSFPDTTARWMKKMWSEELSTAEFGAETQRQIADGIRDEIGPRHVGDIEQKRDRQLLGLLKLMAD